MNLAHLYPIIFNLWKKKWNNTITSHKRERSHLQVICFLELERGRAVMAVGSIAMMVFELRRRSVCLRMLPVINEEDGEKISSVLGWYRWSDGSLCRATASM